MLTLIGCSIQPKLPPLPDAAPIITEKFVYSEVKCDIPAAIPEIEILKVKIHVLTDVEGFSYIAMNPNESKKLALNLAGMVDYMGKNKLFKKFLIDCIAGSKARADKLNSSSEP